MSGIVMPNKFIFSACNIESNRTFAKDHKDDRSLRHTNMEKPCKQEASKENCEEW